VAALQIHGYKLAVEIKLYKTMVKPIFDILLTVHLNINLS